MHRIARNTSTMPSAMLITGSLIPSVVLIALALALFMCTVDPSNVCMRVCFFVCFCFLTSARFDFVSAPKSGKRPSSSVAPAESAGSRKKVKRSSFQYGRDMDWDPDEDEGGEKRKGRGGGRPHTWPATRATPLKLSLTHEEVRQRCCVGCLCYFSREATTRGELVTETSSTFKDIREYLALGNFAFSCCDPRLPYLVCFACRSAVSRFFSKNNSPPIKRIDVHGDGRSKLVERRVVWRHFVCAGKMECPLCQLATAMLFGGKNVIRKPREEEKEIADQEKPKK